MAGKHDWNDLENYLHVALKVLDEHPIVVDFDIDIQPSPNGGRIVGEVSCHGEVILHVAKYWEVRLSRGRKRARTLSYSYHARYRDGRDILRYDNFHSHGQDPTPHHRHDFRFSRERITHVGPDWPHLSEVLDEVQRVVWTSE